MATTIRCYKYSLSDDPFLTFDVKHPSEMIKKLAEEISWRDHANDIWVRVGMNSLMYDPMLDTFKDWNGVRWVNISIERIAYYF